MRTFINMLNTIEELQYTQSRSVLAQRLISGPTDSERKEVSPKQLWFRISGGEFLCSENPNYFSSLLSLSSDSPSRFAKNIERDVTRTFTKNLKSDSGSTESLRNVLVGYSIRNPVIGYCQGMNVLAGRLLTLGFSEEKAFWMLTQIVETYFPIDYFALMNGLFIDQRVFNVLLSKRLPAIYQHLSEFNIDMSSYVVKWLICIFAYSFPTEVLVRVWDLFFVEGNSILFSVALSILYLNQDLLLGTRDFDTLIKIIDTCPQTVTDPEILVSTAMNDPRFFVDRDRLEEIREDVRSLNEEDDGYVIRTLSNFCRDRDDCLKKSKRTSSFFTFKAVPHLEVVEEYIDQRGFPKHCDVNVSDSVMMGVYNHVCSFQQIKN